MFRTRCASPVSRYPLAVLVVVLLCSTWVRALAQPPDSNWLAFYGDVTGDDAVYAAVENSNWTYFLAGHTESYGIDGKSDFWLLKVNIFGDTLWTQTYGGALREGVSAMQPTPDGGCIMAGYTQSYGEGLSDIYILRAGADGTVVRSTNYGGLGSDQAYDIQPTADGGYIITGFTTDIPDTAGDTLLGDQVFLVKTDEMGNVDWARSYGGQFQDYGRSVKQTADGGYIIAGNSWTDYTGHSELMLLKAEPNGAFSWWRKYGFSGDDFGYAVFQNADGGFTAIGDTELDGTLPDVYLVRTDSSGNEINWEHYGGPAADYARDAKRTPDGNIIVAGYTYSWITGTDPDNYVMKVTENGDSLWAKSYAWTDNLREFGYCVLPTSDQGYLVVGRTDYNGLLQDDGFALKLGGFIEPHVFRQFDLGVPIEHFIYVEDTVWVGFGGGGRAAAQTVVSVELLLDTLLHTSTGDLEITLSHLGVTDTIVYRAGGADTNFIGTRISDGATVPIVSGAAPFTSLYKPYKPLAAFAGLDPEGAWILGVTDVVAGNNGTLEAWGLNFNLDVAVGIEPRDATIPEKFTLHQNYPNPFNPETRIDIDLPEPAFVTLEIFDILGRKVATLLNETLAAGSYKTGWNAADHPSGVYFYRVTKDGRQTVGKMLLVR